MTDPLDPTTAHLVEVVPNVPDAPIVAVEVTTRNAADIAARFGAMPLVITGESPVAIRFDATQCATLTTEARPGDWIVRHIRNTRPIEVFTGPSFFRAYRLANVNAEPIVEAMIEPDPVDAFEAAITDELGPEPWTTYVVVVELPTGGVRVICHEAAAYPIHTAGLLAVAAEQARRDGTNR